MARVIVILALMLAITAAMVAITRKSAILPGEAASEPSATVHLTEVPDTDKDQETESLKSTEPRTFSNTIQSAALASPTASAQDVAHGPVAGAAPAFGTAGIDHKGNASFTGTATPGDAVSLMSGGKTVGTTTADAKGTWSLDLKSPKSSHEQELLVSAQGKDGTTVIGPQRAVIAPPVERGGLPRITLKAADQTVTATKEVSTATPEAKTGLVVEKVASGDGDLTLLSGKADPGATVKVAINGKPAGEAQVDDAGAWSIAATNPSGKTADSLRLELLDKSGATLDKTDVPYKVPAAATKVATAAPVAKSDFPSVLTSKPSPRKKPSKKSRSATALSEPSTATDIAAGTIVKVRRGDSLWRIARRHLGKGKKWAAFYKANKEKIDNPDLIYPGQVLVIPG
jgi:nucleoid-associated protein YgaU